MSSNYVNMGDGSVKPGSNKLSAQGLDDPNLSQGSSGAPIESFGVRRGSLTTGTTSTGNNSKLDFLVGLAPRRGKQSKINQFLFGERSISAYNMNVLGTASHNSSTRKGFYATVFPWCDETTQRQSEFKEEMRLLSRLRHPCKLLTSHLSQHHQRYY